jgi:hypothetical protein
MIIPFSIAFLYHAILKCGTEGGFRLKLPLIVMWGSFRWGSDQLKFIMLFSLLTALETIDLQLSQMLVNFDLILFSTLETVFFALFKPLEMVDFTLLIALETAVLMLFHALETVDFILFQRFIQKFLNSSDVFHR